MEPLADGLETSASEVVGERTDKTMLVTTDALNNARGEI